MGKVGLINSGGASGNNDFNDAVKPRLSINVLVVWVLFSGRKAFQRPRAEGIRLLNNIQDVYLCNDVTLDSKYLY